MFVTGGCGAGSVTNGTVTGVATGVSENAVIAFSEVFAVFASVLMSLVLVVEDEVGRFDVLSIDWIIAWAMFASVAIGGAAAINSVGRTVLGSALSVIDEDGGCVDPP